MGGKPAAVICEIAIATMTGLRVLSMRGHLLMSHRFFAKRLFSALAIVAIISIRPSLRADNTTQPAPIPAP